MPFNGTLVEATQDNRSDVLCRVVHFSELIAENSAELDGRLVPKHLSNSCIFSISVFACMSMLCRDISLWENRIACHGVSVLCWTC